MSDEFKDKFSEIGALWATKSGKGWSGKITIAEGQSIRIFVFPNRSEKPTAPIYKIFVARDEQPAPAPPDDSVMPF